MDEWLYRTSPSLAGKRVHRLGLSGTFGIDEAGVRAAMDRGVNLFFWTSRAKGLAAPLRAALQDRRDSVTVVSAAAPAWFGGNVRRGAEKVLRQLGTDYLDVLLLGWVGVLSSLTPATLRELVQLRTSGKVRAIGVSIHDRPRAGRLAVDSPLDVLMIRYNAAHPGAESDIFPYLRQGKPAVLAYTATSWAKLLKKPKGWNGAAMTAGDCYRFQLSNPHVDFAWMGAANRQEVEQNLDALAKGPLTPDEDAWMRDFGRTVHG